ncbi:MAG TPA: hypothetical protein VFP40_10170, partial [Terriglobales bacterium]|nr:hypothetical protein [Terriglobales bacterium]
VNEMGQPLVDDTFLVLLNSSHESVRYTVPDGPHAHGWEQVLDTNDLEEPFKSAAIEEWIELQPRSVVLLREKAAQQ